MDRINYTSDFSVPCFLFPCLSLQWINLVLSNYLILIMPLIKVQTSANAPAKEEIQSMLKGLSAKLAKHTSKPESYVMTAFESETPMTFGGTDDPACYIEIKSVGTMTPQQTKLMSEEFCQEINQNLKIPKNRIYIEFADAKGAMWGWNGTTFG